MNPNASCVLWLFAPLFLSMAAVGCCGSPMQASIDTHQDDNRMITLAAELQDSVQPDGSLGPPSCPTPTPALEVEGLRSWFLTDMEENPWGEPYLYQCVGIHFRIISPRGKKTYRVVDGFTLEATDATEDEVYGEWP